MLNPVFYHRLMLSFFVCIEQSCWCSLANTMKCLTGSSCFYWFHSADDRHRNITFYFSNFRTCSAPEKEVGRWIRKETRNEIKTSTPSEWSYQGGFILSLTYSWDPIGDFHAGLLTAISFLIASLFVNVLKLLAMTCLILLYTKGYVWKGNLTQNLNQMTDEVIYLQKNEMEKDFLKLQEAHEGQQALLQKLQVSGICYNK